MRLIIVLGWGILGLFCQVDTLQAATCTSLLNQGFYLSSGLNALELAYLDHREAVFRKFIQVFKNNCPTCGKNTNYENILRQYRQQKYREMENWSQQKLVLTLLTQLQHLSEVVEKRIPGSEEQFYTLGVTAQQFQGNLVGALNQGSQDLLTVVYRTLFHYLDYIEVFIDYDTSVVGMSPVLRDELILLDLVGHLANQEPRLRLLEMRATLTIPLSQITQSSGLLGQHYQLADIHHQPFKANNEKRRGK